MNKVKKGLVLEINKNKVILMTPDGRFIRQTIKGKIPEIGTEVPINSPYNWKAWSVMGVAALLAIIFIPFLSLQMLIAPEVAVAYVTVDINPSIELGLDKDDKVILFKALNKEGNQILDNIDILNLPVENAIELITEEAIKEKYLSSNKENTVLISYSTEKHNKQKEYSQKSSRNKEEYLEGKVKEVVERNKQKAVVEVIYVSPKVRNKAQEVGLSTGKYTLMLEAWEQGIEISPEHIKEKNIMTAIKEVGGNPNQVLEHIHMNKFDEENSEDLLMKYNKKLKEYEKKITDKIDVVKVEGKDRQEKELKKILKELEKSGQQIPVPIQQILQDTEKDQENSKDLPPHVLKKLQQLLNDKKIKVTKENDFDVVNETGAIIEKKEQKKKYADGDFSKDNKVKKIQKNNQETKEDIAAYFAKLLAEIKEKKAKEQEKKDKDLQEKTLKDKLRKNNKKIDNDEVADTDDNEKKTRKKVDDKKKDKIEQQKAEYHEQLIKIREEKEKEEEKRIKKRDKDDENDEGKKSEE